MIQAIRARSIIVVAAVLVIAYLILATTLIPEDLRIVAAFLAAAFSASFTASWMREAYLIVKYNQTDSTSLSYLALWMIGFGVMFSGGYAMLFNYMDRPQAWVALPIFPIGYMFQAFGFWMLSYVPVHSTKRSIGPGLLVYLLVGFMLLVVGFVLGLNVSDPAALPSYVPPFRS